MDFAADFIVMTLQLQVERSPDLTFVWGFIDPLVAI